MTLVLPFWFFIFELLFLHYITVYELPLASDSICIALYTWNNGCYILIGYKNDTNAWCVIRL